MGLFGQKKISWDEEEEEPETQPEEGKVLEKGETEEKVEAEVVEVRTTTYLTPTKEPRKIVHQSRRVTEVSERLNRLPVNDRYQLCTDVAASVIEGIIPCAIIGGRGGTGKSHMVVEELLKMKYKRVEHEDYILIKAGVSPFGLYKFIVMMEEKAIAARAQADGKKGKNGKPVKPKIPVIVIDDVPFWKDKKMLDLMKGLTGTEDRRIVSWLTDRAEIDREEAKKLGKLPAQVEYTGGVIVITNEAEKTMNKPLLDRSIYLPLEVTDEEMAERMRTLVHKVEPGMDKKLKQDVLNWILSAEYEGKERSMRTLVKALKLARANPQNWLRMVQIV